MLGRKYKLRSRKYIREKRQRFIVQSAIYTGILILFIVLFALSSHLEQFEIRDINIRGNDVISTKDIRSVVEGELVGKYFSIFLRNNSIIFPRKNISSNIMDRYKRIDDVDVSFSGLHSILVSVGERASVGVWCSVASARDNFDESECFFLDSDGYIFSTAPKFSGNLFFRYYGGDVGQDVVGTFYLPEQKFKEISFFLQSFKNIGLNPVSYEWGSDSNSKVTVEPNGDSNIDSVILFNNTDDLSRIFENLGLVLEDDTFSGDSIISLEYIDLRFGNKVYFK